MLCNHQGANFEWHQKRQIASLTIALTMVTNWRFKPYNCKQPSHRYNLVTNLSNKPSCSCSAPKTWQVSISIAVNVSVYQNAAVYSQILHLFQLSASLSSIFLQIHNNKLYIISIKSILCILTQFQHRFKKVTLKRKRVINCFSLQNISSPTCILEINIWNYNLYLIGSYTHHCLVKVIS